MYVSMYVCMCLYISTYSTLYIHIHIIYIYKFVYIYIYICVYVYISIYTSYVVSGCEQLRQSLEAKTAEEKAASARATAQYWIRNFGDSLTVVPNDECLGCSQICPAWKGNRS